MPRADDLVPFALAFNPTRCTTNPLGVKGCGEAGAVAGFPAVGNAIRDALALRARRFHRPGDTRADLAGAAALTGLGASNKRPSRRPALRAPQDDVFS